MRARGVNQNFPVRAKFEWQGFNPDAYRARYVPFAKLPQTINQRYIVNWNNKSAREFRAADSNWEYTLDLPLQAAGGPGEARAPRARAR